jgi:hypothetical protein
MELIIQILAIGKKKFLWNLANLGHFVHAKSFVLIEIIFFRSKIGQ